MFEPVTAKVPPATFFTQSIEDCVIYLANVHDRAHYEWPIVVVEDFDSTITQSLGTQLFHRKTKCHWFAIGEKVQFDPKRSRFRNR